MTTTYFALGVISILLPITLGIIIYSFINVIKSKKQFNQLRIDFEREFKWMETYFRDRVIEIDQRIENTYVNARDISHVYTDSKIEKLEAKLSEDKKQSTKNLIKG